MLLELRKDPEIIYKIYQNASTDKVAFIFSNLFMDNFYENLLSLNNVEDELLILIYRALKDEFININSLSEYDKFLKNTKCGCLLQSIKKKYEVRLFFHNFLQPIIIELGLKRNENWSFIINTIKNIMKNTPEENNPKSMYEKEKEKIYSKDRLFFFSNYLSSLEKKYLEIYINECENKIIKEFCNKQLNENDPNKQFYSSSHLIDLITNEENSEELFNYYIKCFMSARSILLLIFQNLLNNAQAIPHIIRCVCKMIKIIVIQKFPQASTIDIYKYVAKFFFTIFTQYIKAFDLEVYIDCIFDSQLNSKISEITKIMNNIIRGEMFNTKNSIHYIPFNWLLIKEIMPIYYEFFGKLTNFTFSPYIEKLTSGEIPIDNYFYDYFQENPDKHFRYFNFCLTVNDYLDIVNVLIQVYNDMKDPLELNQNYIKNYNNDSQSFFMETRKRIVTYINKYIKIEDIMNEIKEKCDKKGEKNYLLYQREIYRKDFEKRKNAIENKDKLIFYTTDTKIKESNISNLIIDFENYLSIVLYYDKHISNINSENRDFLSLLNESVNFLKTTISLENIKPYWYAQTLIALLEKINENNIKIEDILLELKDKLIESINELDNSTTICTEIINDMKNLEKIKSSYKYIEKSLMEIEMNKELVKISNSFDEKLAFEININKRIFHIYEKKLPEDKTIISHKKLECTKDFNSFIEKFPQINKELLQEDDDYFQIIQEMKVPEQILKIKKVFENKISNYKNYIQIDDREIISLLKDNLINPNIKKENEKKNKIQDCLNEIMKNDKYSISQDKINHLMTYTETIIKFFNEIELKNQERKDKNNELNEYRKRLFSKINDLIFEKLYDKIYPLELNLNDFKVFHKCVVLSWVQPHHIIKENYLIHENFFTDIINFIKLVDSERVPRKKMEFFNKLNNYIIETITFNEGHRNNEEKKSTLVFIYAIIKAKPHRMMSNITYMDLFLDKEISQNNRLLDSLKKIINNLINLSHKDLINISESEYRKNCENSLNN